MIEKIPPKGVSFSDLICIFAMSCYDFKFDTCQIKKNVHIWASSSCNVDLEALSLSRNSWQYDGYFSALAFFVCAIIVFIILLVVIW